MLQMEAKIPQNATLEQKPHPIEILTLWCLIM